MNDQGSVTPKLTIVGLPLGNIEDISLRAIKKLQSANQIICEDTRVFNKLWMKLHSLGFVPEKYLGKLNVINDFNEAKQILSLMKVIKDNDETVLISDAGMPLISDPGYKLVRELVKEEIDVDVVPGPTAATTALAISGLPSDKFLFIGFLPMKNSKREELLGNINALRMNTTIIMYESPYRLKKTLKELQHHLGDLNVSISFELTKQHEKTIRGTFSSLTLQLESVDIKGEVTLLFHFVAEK